MKTLTKDAYAAAEQYMVLNARLIDRLRFGFHCSGEPAEPILNVLRGYQNPDGGFGKAIEPDLRGAGSQPQGVEMAFWMLDEIDAFSDPCVTAACYWLEASSTDEGGVPWVLASVVDDERGPWWQPQGDRPSAALNPTAPIAGLLHEYGVEHPWIAPATKLCWKKISEIEEVGAYDAMCILAFLQRVPDRERATAEFDRLAASLRATAELDPDAPGHVHSPLDLAPRPEALARGLFTDAEIDLLGRPRRRAERERWLGPELRDVDASRVPRMGRLPVRRWVQDRGMAPDMFVNLEIAPY